MSHKSERKKKKIYAYFLPQFYPTPENDKHWGKNFTEWHNVKKAKPYYIGHRQPIKPVDLGYYDFSKKDHVKKVIKYSQSINIDGLIYWHYWFGDKFITLEKIPKLHVEEKDINQKFCFAWANGDWSRSWRGDDKTIIFKQKYSKQSLIDHLDYLTPFLLDERYILYQDRFLFQVNNLFNNEVFDYISDLNEICKKRFEKEFHFFIPKSNSYLSKYGNLKFSLTSYPPGEIYSTSIDYKIQKLMKIIGLKNSPIIISENDYVYNFEKYLKKNKTVIPCILSGWDNTPRYGNRGVVVDSKIPNLLQKQLEILNKTMTNNDGVILIKAFNEWAEGNILEPHRYNEDTFNPGEILTNI